MQVLSGLKCVSQGLGKGGFRGQWRRDVVAWGVRIQSQRKRIGNESWMQFWEPCISVTLLTHGSLVVQDTGAKSSGAMQCAWCA